MPGTACRVLSGPRSCAVRSSTASDRAGSYWPGMPYDTRNAADRSAFPAPALRARPPLCSGDDLMKILVVNVNTSQSMTDVIGEAARRYASPGTAVVALRPYFGAEAVDCNFESYLSAVAVMDRVLAYDESYDAVILAGFGEHGRDGLQELIEQPVMEICEASAHVAMMIGHAYSVVTTLRRSVPAIEDRLRLAGLWDRCASVRASGMSTLEVDADPKRAVRAIVAEARRAVEADHAEVICLGCAGMAGLEETITTELGVPVIDGIGAAVRLAEAVVGLGLKTSKISTYAPPDDKKITGWPLWHALGVPRAPGRSDTARAALRSRGDDDPPQ